MEAQADSTLVIDLFVLCLWDNDDSANLLVVLVAGDDRYLRSILALDDVNYAREYISITTWDEMVTNFKGSILLSLL
jgi:hypothetical protein